MALPVDSDLYGILSALTRKHQRYLLTQMYAERLNAKPKPRNNEQRLIRLSSLLGPERVAPYRNAYLHRAARYVALFTPLDPKVTACFIAEAFRTKAPKGEAAATMLVENEPPRFHEMIRNADGSVALDFVSLGNMRTVQDGLAFKEERHVNHDIVAVDAENPIIEIGGRTFEQQQIILTAFAAVLKSKPDRFQHRAIDHPGNWKALQQKLGADIFQDDGIRTKVKEPAAYSVSARRGERLDDLPMWQAMGIKHEEARELGFFYTHRSPIDDYPEMVYFYLRAATGEIKFLEETSESARKQVVSEYLKIV